MQPLAPKPRAVIFDLDGTLADTFPLIVLAWNFSITPITGKTYSQEEVISRFGIPDPAMIKRETPQSTWNEAVENYHSCYEREHHVVSTFEGVDEMLDSLKNCRLPLGLVTGKGHRSADITLRKLGWDKLFNVVITGEDVDEQKPAPQGLLRVAEKLHLQPRDCIYVGDSPADIGAAKNAHMRVIAAGWHTVYAEKIRAMQPDVWAEKPADLLALCGI